MLKSFSPNLTISGDNFSPNKLESILDVKFYRKHEKGNRIEHLKQTEYWDCGGGSFEAPGDLTDMDKMHWMLDLLIAKLDVFYENGVDDFFLVFHFPFTSDGFIIDLDQIVWEKLGKLKIPFTFECYCVGEEEE
jgi:hypothetical protein